jgi:chromosome segregation ATPase
MPAEPHVKLHPVTGQERQDLLWMSLGILLGLLSVAAISAVRIQLMGDPVKKCREQAKQLQDLRQQNQDVQQDVYDRDHTITNLNVQIMRLQATIDAQVRNIADLNIENYDKRELAQALEVEVIPLRRLRDEEARMRRHIGELEEEFGRLQALERELEDMRPRVGEMRDRERGLKREVEEKDRDIQAVTTRNDQLVQRMAYMQQQLAAAR